MAVVMRFVQRFQASKRQEFMTLEKQFVVLEQKGMLPKGERLTPLASREPANTLIWEGHFGDLAAAQQALTLLESSGEHTSLFNQQVQFFESSWVEFYNVLD